MYKSLTTILIKASTLISRVCGLIAAIAIIFLILLTVSDVFLRFVFNSPINGSFELTEYLLVVIVFMAIPWATTQKAHVRVDLLSSKLPKRKQAALYSISTALSMIIIFLLAWYTFPEITYTHEVMFKSDMLGIPVYPFYLIIMVSFFIIFFTLFAILIQYIDEARDK